MFGTAGRAFRFGNVVGPNQTHGVGFDFVRKLLADPTRLEILGDGTQSKSYVHVDDVLAAVLLAGERGDEPFAVFNVATGDYITVARDRRARGRVPRARPRRGRARLQRRRPRLEGRRARRAHRHRSHPRPRLEEPLQLARTRCGASIALDARRRTRRAALVTQHAARGLPRPRRRAQRAAVRRRAARTPAEAARRGRHAARRRRGVPPAGGRGLAARRRHEPARHRPGHHAPERASTRSTTSSSTGLPITEVLVCPHDDADGCGCRKPLPGMLLEAARAVGHRPERERHGRRPLARHRGRSTGRVCARSSSITATPRSCRSAARPRSRASPRPPTCILDRGPTEHAGRRLGVALGPSTPTRRATTPRRQFRRQLITALVERDGTPRVSSTSAAARATSSRRSRERWPRRRAGRASSSAPRASAALARRCRPRGSVQIDLLKATDVPPELEGWADVAVCSEVLEHVDDPARSCGPRRACIAPGRTARRHRARRPAHRVRPLHRASPALPTGALRDGARGGRPRGRARHAAPAFPSSTSTSSSSCSRGKALVRDVSSRARAVTPGHASRCVSSACSAPGLNSSRFGWQLVAASRRRLTRREAMTHDHVSDESVTEPADQDLRRRRERRADRRARRRPAHPAASRRTRR